MASNKSLKNTFDVIKGSTVNIVVPQGLNDSIIEQVGCMLLHPEVIRLPIKKRELHLRLKKARDRAVLLVVEDDCKTQRQVDDLTEVLQIIRTENNFAEYKGLTKIYLPCVISEIPLGNLTGRDTFFVEVKKIPWQKSECNRLSGSKIAKGLVCFVEKHPENLKEIIDCAKRLRTNDERFSEYLGLLQAMEISEHILKKFLKMRGIYMKVDYRATEHLISNSLSMIEDGGVIEAFVEVFRKMYFSQKLSLYSPRTPIPDNMSENLWAIETDSTVNFDPAVFERILKHMPFLVNSLKLMQLLYTENILEADNSGKRCYKKKTRYTKPNGEVAYDRFVVLRKDKLGIGDEIL